MRRGEKRKAKDNDVFYAKEMSADCLGSNFLCQFCVP